MLLSEEEDRLTGAVGTERNTGQRAERELEGFRGGHDFWFLWVRGLAVHSYAGVWVKARSEEDIRCCKGSLRLSPRAAGSSVFPTEVRWRNDVSDQRKVCCLTRLGSHALYRIMHGFQCY